jgi:hypothetical protein
VLVLIANKYALCRLSRISHPSPACFSCRSVVSAARLHKEHVSIVRTPCWALFVFCYWSEKTHKQAICDRLASWQREECVKTINNFGAKLSFLTVKHEMSPESVCEHMGVCGEVAEAAVVVAPEDILVPFGQIKCQICEVEIHVIGGAFCCCFSHFLYVGCCRLGREAAQRHWQQHYPCVDAHLRPTARFPRGCVR